MTTVIWILKVLIALLFTFTGLNKMLLPKAKLFAKGMKGLTGLDEKKIKIVGLLEILGVLGLILPALLNIYPVLSDISALCLALSMIVAGSVHYKMKLSVIPNIVVFILCLMIVYLDLK